MQFPRPPDGDTGTLSEEEAAYVDRHYKRGDLESAWQDASEKYALCSKNLPQRLLACRESGEGLDELLDGIRRQRSRMTECLDAFANSIYAGIDKVCVVAPEMNGQKYLRDSFMEVFERKRERRRAVCAVIDAALFTQEEEVIAELTHLHVDVKEAEALLTRPLYTSEVQ